VSFIPVKYIQPDGGKNVNPMALSTSLVLLEDTEPNSPFIALSTPDY